MTPTRPSGLDSSHNVTGLLLRWSEGDAAALPRLLPIVYEELRRMAGVQLRKDARDQTLAPTALVHELYLRLVDQRSASWNNRAHFYAVAASLMRRIIVDHVRASQAQKRGGTAVRISLDHLETELATASVTGLVEEDLLAIDAALDRLAAIDADQVRIIELRFFAGLTVEETAHVLKRSPRTVKREWRLARAWLYRELQ
ncbi:MAG: sigma-70 family RNA polymerase sigma factor [Vicinamibacterales bacterium]